MKTSILTGLVAALLMTQARAGYMYWTVDNATLPDGSAANFAIATVRPGELDDHTARFESWSSETESQFLVTAGTSPSSAYNYNFDNDNSFDGPIYSYFADPAGTGYESFLLELWGEDGKCVGWQSVARETLDSNKSLVSDMSASGAGVFSFASVVPEPSSGLLLMLGFAGLALKRRRTR